jgi:uncharacterized protein (DUF1501 family)
MKRRNFLKIIPPATITPFMVNGHSMTPFAHRGLAGLLSDCEDVEGRTLVLIQLKGGNDGLNMIIPVAQYDQYVALRPDIAVPESGSAGYIMLDTTLKNSKQVGLHPAMVEIKEMYDEGWVNIIQGVGYEQPNQSHFKSTDLWMSGGDGTYANNNIPSGWMGRSLQALFPDVLGAPTTLMPDPLGIQVGDAAPSLGFHTETEHQNVINLSGQDVSGFYSLISTIGGAPPVNIPDFEHGEEIEYIMSVENSVNLYAQRISAVFNAGTNMGTYPNNTFANQLKTVARLIRGGSKTKIFLCQLGGFDTHDSQVGATPFDGSYGPLMQTLSQAVKAFFDDLDAMGLAKQVLACTFSEFGRCAKQNGSTGTDHGTLAPMLIFGKSINAGVTGTNVNLSNLTSDNQLQGLQNDYRQVFSTLLQDWLGANDYVMQETLFDGYMKLPFIESQFVVGPGCYYGGSVIVNGVNDPNAQQRKLALFPNPARISVEVSVAAQSDFKARLSLHSMTGHVIYSGKTPVQKGDNFFHLDVADTPAGTYFVRLENLETGMAEVAKLQVVK